MDLLVSIDFIKHILVMQVKTLRFQINDENNHSVKEQDSKFVPSYLFNNNLPSMRRAVL
ncbi:MAG: hypothetical protein ACLTFB_02300 [Candidatus Phytoplasma pyri]